ncbi:MAG: hypothetical protein WCI22_01500, partial [Actinomycetota bacterium]
MVARVAVSAVLVALLVGVPVAVVARIGVSAPSWEQLRRAWTLHQLDDGLVLRAGVMLFVVLWCWFAATAVAECWRALDHRRTGRPLPPASNGPGGWLKSVVRFVVLSSATASLVASVGVHGSSAATRPAARVAVAAVPSSRSPRSGADGPVDPGGVAATHAESPSAPPGTTDGSSNLVSYLSGMGSALLLSAGVVGAIESRRRRQWRQLHTVPVIEQRNPALVHVETQLRTVHADDTIARLDVALRSIARDLARQRSQPLAVTYRRDGTIFVTVRSVAVPSDPSWSVDASSGEWVLRAEASLEHLASLACDVPSPCPSLVHLGTAESGDQHFVDLEALGTLAVQSPCADDIVRAIAASLAFSPFMQGATLITCGEELEVLDTHASAVASVEHAASIGEASRIARRFLGTTSAAASATSTFMLRVVGSAGESWDPAVIVATGCGEFESIDVEPASGLALVVDRAAASSEWMLTFDVDHHVL